VKSLVKNTPHLLFHPEVRPELALREGSPEILAHLQEGCLSCSAGLRLFADPALPVEGYAAALYRFEKELATELNGSSNPVMALHVALSELAG